MKKNILKIKYFGVPLILYNEKTVKFPMKKLEALVYYLGYYKRADRVELVNLLWSDKDETLGRKNLRNAIYKLKKELNIEIISSSNEQLLEINPNLIIENDLPENETSNDMHNLKLEFLKGFFVKNSDEFDQWISLKRQQYDEKYMKFLKERLKNSYEEKNNDDVEKFLNLIIERDTYNEEYYRELMLFLLKNKKYNNAINLYSSLKKLLDDELGISPDMETKNLFLRILDTKEKISENENTNIKYFYGRDKYIDDLIKNYYNFSKNLDFNSIFIRGEAGIGKTKLKDEFIKRIGKNFYFLESQSYQMEKKYYLKPWYKIFETIKTILSTENIKVPRTWEDIIAFAFPNFVDDERSISGGNIENMESLKYPAIENTIVKLFNKIASTKKIIISIDDIQWMDMLSLNLLKAILINGNDNGIMFIGTLRTGHDDNLDGFLSSLNMSKKIKTIDLERFTAIEVYDYLDNVFGKNKMEYNLKERIYRETEGNTYFLVEYVNNITDGKLIPEITQEMKDILRSRVIDISDEGKKLLNIMSMFFDEIPFEILNSVSSKTEMEIIDIIEDLKKRNIIVELNSNSGIIYRFTHQKIREFIYGEQSLTSKVIFHARIADIIEKTLQGNTFDKLIYTKLIYHYSKAGKFSKSIKYKLKNVHDYLDFSHELIPENHNISDVDKGSLIISNDMTIDLIKDIEDDILKLKKEYLDNETKNTLIEFYHIKGRFFIREGIYDEGIESIDAAKKMSIETENYEYMINCYLQYIYIGIQLNDHENMKINIDKALRVSQDYKIYSRLGTIMRLKGLYYLLIKDFSKAIMLLNKSIDLFERYENDSYIKDLNVAAVYNYIGEIKRNTMEFSEALGFYERAIEICKIHNSLNGMTAFYTNYALALYELGRYEEAEIVVDKAIEYFEITGLVWRRALAEAVKSLILLKKKKYDNLDIHFNRAVSYSEKMKNPRVLGMIYRVKANIRAEMTSNEKLRVKFNDIFKEKIDYYCDKGISFYKETEDGYEQKILEKMKKNIDI